jgi:hypothetical protein
MNEATVSEIAQEILGHLRRNPEAQDTLAGIVQWWLPSREIRSRTATIKDALSELVEAGLVIRIEGKYAQVSYRLCAFENQPIDPNDEAASSPKAFSTTHG